MTVVTGSGPALVVANFAYNAGGWRIDMHPRFMADTTGEDAPISSASATPASTSRAQTPTAPSATPARRRQLRLQRRRVAHRHASTLHGRYHRRRTRRYRRLRRRRGVCLTRQRQRHLQRTATSRRQLRLQRRRVAHDRHPRFMADTPATGAPISSASATPASGCIGGDEHAAASAGPHALRRNGVPSWTRSSSAASSPMVPCGCAAASAATISSSRSLASAEGSARRAASGACRSPPHICSITLSRGCQCASGCCRSRSRCVCCRRRSRSC